MSEPISTSGRAHLAWALTSGVGPIVFGRLVERFGSAEKALGASASALTGIKGIGRETAEKMARERDGAVVEQEIEAAAEAGVRIICREDADFPPGLKQIPDPPLVLFVQGELQPEDAVAIAIVGARKCSIYGSEQARRFGELLAGAGFTVISGLARGIDAFAHHGAVDAGGRSIAILGNGLSEIYPPENLALAERLLANGAWVSELPMRASVRAENFPGRNRIIAGMALGTLVVEAGARSGAQITARYTSEYNREVFAVPGRLQEPTAIGTNALIRDGSAKLVTCLEDILEELGEVGAALRGRAKGAASAAKSAGGAGRPAGGETHAGSPVALSKPEEEVFAAIRSEPILQELVLSRTQLPVPEVLAAFTSLELKGLIKRLPGQMVARAR